MNSPTPWSFRGSEWHRWDPHIHAPGTVLEDQFKGDWDGYLNRIEAATPQIRALGVTDYLCIDTYKNVRARNKAGRLPNVELLFPNVEIRLDVKTSREKGINLHLLFSPDDPQHEEEIERILGRLLYHCDGRDYACSRAELITLGRKYDPSQTDEDGAFCKGVEQFKVNTDALRRVFKDDRWLEENCLVAVASASGDGVSGLQGDDAFSTTREEIQRFAQLIFSSNNADRIFWLGLKPGTDRKEIERLYRGLKPCLHGCDAHSVDRVGAPVGNRFCWIKGDLSFETLRQAVIDPEERVIVRETPPIDEAYSVTIRQVRAIGTPWLKGETLELNRGLVCIIGARGSGKTALVDLIAAGADAMDSDPGESSFLKRASSPVDLIGDAQVEEIWADGDKYVHPFRLPGEWDEPSPLVRYLSQQFVDRLCSASGLAVQLRQEIERVIFAQSERRLETDSFDELSGLLLKPIRRRREQHRLTIATNSGKMAEEARQRELLPKLKKTTSSLLSKSPSHGLTLRNCFRRDSRKKQNALLLLRKHTPLQSAGLRHYTGGSTLSMNSPSKCRLLKIRSVSTACAR